MKKIITVVLLLCVVAFAQQKGSFTDSRDKKTYKTVKIGKQTWMAENLNYAAKNSECYENKPGNCKKYGRLYDRQTAISICPSGWHLPSGKEWQTLVDFVGGSKAAETKLRAKNGWNDYTPCIEYVENWCEEYGEEKKSGNGTDNYGFSALPGGFAAPWAGRFVAAGNKSLWLCTSDGNEVCYHMIGEFSDPDGDFGRDIGSFSFSVRCIQD